VLLADYLGAIARELRGGGTVTAAFVAVTPHHPGGVALVPVCRRVIDGTPLVEALADPPPSGRRRPATVPERADVDVAIHALGCAADLGGPAAVAVDAAASVLRERAATIADAQAHSAQGRLSARVLTIVPLAFAGWTVTTDQRARHVYTATTIGAACVVVGLALNGAGWWWMRRIIDPRSRR
jgi:tight adherence protein B